MRGDYSSGLQSFTRNHKFIEYNFTNDGEYKLDVVRPAIGGKDNNNCRFCIYNESEQYCPKETRQASF